MAAKKKRQAVPKRARAQLPAAGGGGKNGDVAARWVHVSTLTGWAANPRQNDSAVQPVADSIIRFGWGAPILAREANGEVVAGHTRLRAVELLASLVAAATAKDSRTWHPDALRSAREGLVPVRFGDWSEKDAHLLALADNRLGEIADWDVPKLADLLGDWDPPEIEAAGWTAADLDAMAADIAGGGSEPPKDPPPPDNPADDELPEKVEPVTKQGEDFQVGRHRLVCADCVEVMKALPDASVDSIVTDPPYGIGFMGKGWDVSVPGAEWASECLRVLKPGGHIIAFAATRTIHKLTTILEDGGFEIRDQIGWLQWQGFPKSLDVGKAIDRELTREPGADMAQELRFTAWMRESGVTAAQIDEATGTMMGSHYLTSRSQPAIPTARLLDMFRHLIPDPPAWIEDEIKSREQSKVEAAERNEGAGFLETLRTGSAEQGGVATDAAKQWDAWGTALKPACEPAILARKPLSGSTVAENVLEHGTGGLNVDGCRIPFGDAAWPGPNADLAEQDYPASESRGPALSGVADGSLRRGFHYDPKGGRWPANIYVCPKPARSEREKGTEGLDKHVKSQLAGAAGGSQDPVSERFRSQPMANIHPTVKPVRLMRWLVRLVTPPGGTVLDSFLGSGTTLIACEREGFTGIGIEAAPDYMDICRARVAHAVEPDDG